MNSQDLQDLLKIREILKSGQAPFWNDQCLVDDEPKMKYSFVAERTSEIIPTLLNSFKKEFGRRLRFAGFVFHPNATCTDIISVYSIGLEE